MTYPWFQKAASAVAAIALSCSACAQQADFNEVGKQMAITLQNAHFARLPFNAELSQRFLGDYLKDLDFQRLYPRGCEWLQCEVWRPTPLTAS
jgi:carboxyl-terminal processing protease